MASCKNFSKKIIQNFSFSTYCGTKLFLFVFLLLFFEGKGGFGNWGPMGAIEHMILGDSSPSFK